jgi:pyridoxal 5'-phosphate synthase pdxT subunit
MSSSPLIGILALQGDFKEHAHKFASLGCSTREIRRISELEGINALVLPGGESTTVALLEQAEPHISKAQSQETIFDAIKRKAQFGMPIWGTCMGSILLAREIEGSTQGRLALMDIKVRRNAFGPQRFSSEIPISIPTLGAQAFPGIFIRAPLILEANGSVEVLGSIGEGIVMARQGKLLATVFHPEVVGDSRVHEYFLRMITANSAA